MIEHTVVNSVRLVNQCKGDSGVWARSGLVISALRKHTRGIDKRFRPSPQGRLVETLTVVVNHDCFVWAVLHI